MESTGVVWFRLDLRLADNPALAAAVSQCRRIVPAFIWAPEEEGEWAPGEASRWWLDRSLRSLEADLSRFGTPLVFRRGPSLASLRTLVRESGAQSVFWNRRDEPAMRRRDALVQQALSSEGCRVETFNVALLFDPDRVRNRSGAPFRVFTPFWRACLAEASVPPPIPTPRLRSREPVSLPSLTLDELGVASTRANEFERSWLPGEATARRRLRQFLGRGLDRYPERRDYPALPGTSRLSPHLHFGEISPRQVWAACGERPGAASKEFLRQLGWREFGRHLLFHFPETVARPMRPEFESFRWRADWKRLEAWQEGRTGFAIVDAGMKELEATGWMHNRVRMIAGSFLTKDLLITWTEGARWFWDRLVDADLANNTFGWQWIAGCGADAAPYYRVFNPIAQAARFDPNGDYVARWAPGCDEERPRQIVNHERARERALDAWAALKRER